MKPKTKFQKKIVSLSKSLGGFTEKQRQWAISMAPKYYVISRNRHYCLECGHKWNNNTGHLYSLLDNECPECGAKLEYCESHAIAKDGVYLAVVTTHKGFQVIRILLATKYLKKKQKATCEVREVIQHWISPEGKMETLTVPALGLTWQYDAWTYGELEPHYYTDRHHERIRISALYCYPYKSFIPEVWRNGFEGTFFKYSEQRFLELILSDSKFETLIKTGQYSVVRKYTDYQSAVIWLWKSILICTKQGYIIPDFVMWSDYLVLLEESGKDIKCPKYICPRDLKAEHDKLVANKNAKLEQIRILKDKKLNDNYLKSKGKFFGMQLTDGTITVSPLKSVAEFKAEGDALNHCVYVGGYYKRDNVLILSAKIEGKSIETIEINLEQVKVVQCRGRFNQATEFHEQIMNLVESNLPQVRKLIKQKTA